MAVAETGPTIVEGNFRYDPPVTRSFNRHIQKLLASGGEAEDDTLLQLVRAPDPGAKICGGAVHEPFIPTYQIGDQAAWQLISPRFRDE